MFLNTKKIGFERRREEEEEKEEEESERIYIRFNSSRTKMDEESEVVTFIVKFFGK